MNPFIQSATIIFGLRVIDVSLATMRVLMVMRGRKSLAWTFGFCQALVYLIAFKIIFSDLGNWFNILGYAAGFATGNVVGMLIENYLAIGHTHIRIISSRRGSQISEHLREAGYAVTEIAGHGKDGTISVLNCSILRNKVNEVCHLVESIDSQAMLTAEDVYPLHRGFWRA